VHASQIVDDVRGMHAIVSIRSLTVSRGKTKILQNVNWEIESRDNWVLLGANGSGKTTLLSCITGYVTPSSGRIRVLDQEYGKTDWRELRKQVGLVSSSVRQMISDEQLGLDIVASGQQAVINSWKPPRGLERKRAFRLLEQVECQKLANRPWAYFSQGERQRVLIGRALMANHKILILDEPCAGLDPVARERFLEFLQRLATQSTDYSPNLVLVTHHVEEILPCFSRALLLKEGKVLVEGPVRKAVSAKNLSEAFGAELSIRFSRSRFQSRLRPV
jgi:iron complex transport system ATP-binding protein